MDHISLCSQHSRQILPFGCYIPNCCLCCLSPCTPTFPSKPNPSAILAVFLRAVPPQLNWKFMPHKFGPDTWTGTGGIHVIRFSYNHAGVWLCIYHWSHSNNKRPWLWIGTNKKTRLQRNTANTCPVYKTSIGGNLNSGKTYLSGELNSVSCGVWKTKVSRRSPCAFVCFLIFSSDKAWDAYTHQNPSDNRRGEWVSDWARLTNKSPCKPWFAIWHHVRAKQNNWDCLLSESNVIVVVHADARCFLCPTYDHTKHSWNGKRKAT